MPSVNSSSRPIVWASSTVMTPSLPTLLKASAMSSPIFGSCAEIAATCATSDWSSTSRASASNRSLTASTAASMPRLSAIGWAPAATLRRPSRTMAWASTVAVVVPSPATSLVFVATSLTSWAPRFWYGSVSSISLAIVTPSLVIVGTPNFLSRTTLRPRGPRVTLTVSARALTPCSRRCRASSEKLRIFAIYGVPFKYDRPDPRCRARAVRKVIRSLLDDGEDVAGGEHKILLTAVLDLGAAVLRVDDRVADLDVNRDAVALVVDAARADSEDRALLRLLLCGVGDHDARRRGRLSLVRLDQDPVLERLDRNLGRGSHGHTLLGYWCRCRSMLWPASICLMPPGGAVVAGVGPPGAARHVPGWHPQVESANRRLFPRLALRQPECKHDRVLRT